MNPFIPGHRKRICYSNILVHGLRHKVRRLRGSRPFFALATCAIAGVLMASAGCSIENTKGDTRFLSQDGYYGKLYGAWKATMVANHTGLIHEGKYLDEPGPGDSIELVFPDEWSTDDDTAVEWVYLHVLETYGLDADYAADSE